MKPLTKTVASRSGGIAARFAEAGEEGAVGKHAPTAKRPLPALPVGSPPKPNVANSVAKPVANVANKPRYARWREANPKLYKERQAKYQADYRARKAKEPRA